MEGQELWSFLLGGGGKKVTYCFKMYFRTWFSIPTYYINFRYQKLSQPQHVLLLWRSGTVATVLRPLKSVVRKYISPRINFCLYMHSEVDRQRTRLIRLKQSQSSFDNPLSTAPPSPLNHHHCLHPTLPTLPTLPILPTLPTLSTLPIVSVYSPGKWPGLLQEWSWQDTEQTQTWVPSL